MGGKVTVEDVLDTKIDMSRIRCLVCEAKFVAMVDAYPLVIFLVFTALLVLGVKMIKVFDDKFSVPSFPVRLILIFILVAYVRLSFDYLYGINGGKNQMSDTNGSAIAAGIYVELFVLFMQVWMAPFLFVFKKPKKSKFGE
jgi:hypothetical protein